MKKLKAMLVLTGATVALMSFTAYAGQWQQDANGKWWQNDDGSYPAGKWEWIDDNVDGVSESYYFNESGYALTNTATPDGYMVNENGAWVVDGVVQTKTVAVVNDAQTSLETVAQVPESNSQPITVTTGMSNALRSAIGYLDVMPFSYPGLKKQLLYEKYTEEEATYAVDNCGANWYEQAAKSARQYLDVMSFSRDGLINQLEYEGFTHDQAVYGVSQVGY